MSAPVLFSSGQSGAKEVTRFSVDKNSLFFRFRFIDLGRSRRLTLLLEQ